MMQNIGEKIASYLGSERALAIFSGLLVLLLGVLMARLARGLFRRFVGPRVGARYSLLVEKAIYYALSVIAALTALHTAGVDPGVLLGAAGILTLALGFASQTTVSNLISGLFLVGERTFKIGDTLKIGEKTGVVESIDLLSVKLRTFDNVLLRFPNETLLKAELSNLTRYPIRRLDLTLKVAYKEDLRRLEALLEAVATGNPYCLDEPKPTFWFLGYGESAIQIRFAVWFVSGSFWEGKNRLQQEIYEALIREDVEIPFPHRAITFERGAEPFAVRVVDGGS